MQKEHKPEQTRELDLFLQQRIMPSMEIHATSRLILARNNPCTNESSIPTRSGGYGEFKNVKAEFVQKAHKPVQIREVDLFLQRRIIPSMEIQANSRLNLARNNPCTNESSIPTRSWGYGEFKNIKTEFVQKGHKPVQTREVDIFLQQRIMPSMEIHATSRLILARNNPCTNESSIPIRSWVYGEFKNVKTEFVQKGHKPVQTREIDLFLQQRIMPSMEIHATSRLILARNNPCTNESSIPTRSWGYGEFKNVKTEFVQTVLKPVQTSEIVLFLQRRIIPPKEIHANLRLNLARNNPCTNESSIPTRSWGYGEFKNVKTEFVQKGHKPVQTSEIDLFLQQRIMPSMEIHATSRLILARNNPCTNESSIPTRSWGYGEFKNVKTEFVQKGHKPVQTSEIDLFRQGRIMPPVEIHANSRLNLARNNPCTNESSIPTRSWGYGEFKHVKTEFVQTVHKPVQTSEVVLFLQRRIMPPMEINANSRLNLARNNRCTNESSIPTRN